MLDGYVTLKVVGVDVIAAVFNSELVATAKETVQLGALENALPKVTVQVDEASVPIVAMPIPFAPVITGEVPQIPTVSTTVLVINNPPLKVEEPVNVLTPVTESVPALARLVVALNTSPVNVTPEAEEGTAILEFTYKEADPIPLELSNWIS